ACFDHATFYLLAREESQVCGLLPLIYMKSRLFPRCLVSLPYFCNGGVVADDKEIASTLLDEARSLMKSVGAELLLIRQQGDSLSELSCDTSKSTFHIKLDPDPDKVFGRFEKQVRRRIRKASASGLHADWGTRFLPEFYEVYATNMRDLGIPIHSYDFYEAIVSTFRENTQILVVHLGDKAIAAQLLFTFKDRLLLVCAGSLREYLELCPNNLLYWEAVKYGCLKGYHICDFGRSPKGSGPYQFKAQWSGEEIDCPTYYLDVDGRSLRRIQADNSRYHLGREIWKRLPLGITTWLGRRIVRHLP
ncbi:MAG: GNAT family N-acetyltransferase, partial [Terriglobia bacterium]